MRLRHERRCSRIGWGTAGGKIPETNYSNALDDVKLLGFGQGCGRAGKPGSHRVHCCRGRMERPRAVREGITMATTISPPQQGGEQRVVLGRVSWETYESLLADHADASSPRFTYSEGMLEIMSPSSEHEELSLIMATIADIIAEEQQIEFKGFGSATFRRRDLDRGAEPGRRRSTSRLILRLTWSSKWKSPAPPWPKFRFMPGCAFRRSGCMTAAAHEFSAFLATSMKAVTKAEYCPP